jgi:hypothetical protein
MCIIAHTADDVVSKKKTDYEIGSYTVTLSRSERSVALGVEMLRCAQHDNATTHGERMIVNKD